MIIEIAKVSAEGSLFEGEEDGALLELSANDLYTVSEPIRYRLIARKVGRRLVVSGAVEIRLQARCRRCARSFSTFLRESCFLYEYETREGQRDVDVTPELREALLLRLDPHPLCAPACAGLCPRCGRDLNSGPCGCEPRGSPNQSRWSALDKWKAVPPPTGKEMS
ncbi:MAG: DUF177 domain-containing protein [Kiritimatiellae bacterium]|nr:DUF177 domain-containing protein [Kiritimatiellia bacterium]